MKRLALTGALAVLLAVPVLAAAQDPVVTAPQVSLSRTTAAIGEPVVLTIELVAPAGAAVELDPAAEAWGEVVPVRVLSREAIPVEGGRRHRLEVLVAPFAPGRLTFRPALIVTTDAGAAPAVLPALAIEASSTLSAGESLTLSPLPPPVPIAGAQSPLLWPAIILGAIAAALVLAALLALALRAWRNRPREADPPAEPPAPVDVLATAAALLETDAAAAYRAIAGAIRHVLGERYDFPAGALTTAELESRMEGAGVDGWESRLARELLRECDAVVYAGYRPAPERRHADLTVAREIVGAPD